MNPFITIHPIAQLTLAIALAAALPATASTFVYEGRLDDMGQAANGRYDIQLSPYAVEKQGNTIAGPITFEQVEVRDGHFRIDFDLAVTAADSAWLELAVRAGNDKGTYTTIPGRTKANAIAALAGCWSTTGDSGVSAATNFLGTTDVQPINIRANGVQGWSMTGGSDGYVNIIGGGGGTAPTNPPQVLSGAQGAFIGNGGKHNANVVIGPNSGNIVADHNGVVVGGFSNRAGNFDADPENAAAAAVVGGSYNYALATWSFVGGGTGNGVFGRASTISGGSVNRAYGDYSMIGGGGSNVAYGYGSMVPGGFGSCAGGDYSFAAGSNAVVAGPIGSGNDICPASTIAGDNDGHEGSFVWADAQGTVFATTGPNQFLARAAGGFGFNTAAIPANTDMVLESRDGSNADLLMRPKNAVNGINLGAYGDATTAALYISRYDGTAYTDYALWHTSGRLEVFVDGPSKPLGGPWSGASDARLKHNIQPLSNALDRLLTLQGVTFEYNEDAPKGYFVPGVHNGFVAQQVEKVFPDWVSSDNAGYKLVGAKGFEALAVEALRELRLEKDVQILEKDVQIDALSAENVLLKTRLTAIEARLGL